MSETPEATPSTARLPWQRRLLYGATNLALFAAGIVNLAVGTRSALNDKVPIAATSLSAGLVLLFAATVDRFESLKGLGVEAKTKQLSQKIVEAEEVLRRVKEVGELVGAALVDLNSKMGRWDSAPSPMEAYELAQKVREIMTSLRSSPTTVRNTLEPWIRTFCHDLSRAIVTPLEKAIKQKVSELESDLASVPSPWNPDDPALNRIMSERRGIYSCQERLHSLDELTVEDYPDGLIRMLEGLPLDTAVVSPVIEKARAFAPSMRELREDLRLRDPQPWYREIAGAEERREA